MLPAGADGKARLRDAAGAGTAVLRTSLESDNVFSDGWSLQLATVTGSVASGYTARLSVPV
ncbi:MAG TPA: hypothetical protein VE547_20615 [Mycobacteriales bacterium]|nr:hypothetical protein [Mycobacteriales bacterium]